ncbi:MAG: LCP family protein [Eubacteriales bacterium]|nr:LCP family protein [Eubacteriales bacterium]
MMRIFKNRGDIFFSKTNKEKSSEQRFLIIALVLIVIFSVIFVFVTAVKNDFSAKEFFKPDNISVTENVSENEIDILPQVSGKNNFIVLVSEENNLLFAGIIQTDMDNVAYKASMLKADTVVEGEKLSMIFKKSGAENVKKAVESLLNTSIDYYISMKSDKFTEVYEKFGEINYPVINSIKYKNNDTAVPFSVRVKEGEQSLKGSQIIGLMRYYLDVEKKPSLANDIMLTILTQQINENNYENKDELFEKFIASSKTNITVKNYSMAEDSLIVLSNENTGVKVYNAPAEYKNNKITKDSIKEVRGYFVK